MALEIKWLGHASFRLTAGEDVVCVDPYEIAEGPEATLVLVTHDHFDHCSADDIRKLAGPGTQLAGPASCEAKAKGIGKGFAVLAAGDERAFGEVKVKAMPAYNIGKQFHPKSAGGLGYVISMGGESIYHAGDTDAIPEMDGLEADTALLPVGGTYTMNAEEAAAAFKKMRAKKGIPMHYGKVAGSEKDAKKFKKLIAE